MNDLIPESEEIFGHRVCQTSNAKWLRIDNIYEKLHRPNLYDIGGTYIEDVADCWFIYKTEIVSNIHLLHLFVSNRGGGYFNVSVSNRSDISYNKKHEKAFLSSTLKTYKFNNNPEMIQNYITTYSFSRIDVDLLMNVKLYIPVSFKNNLTSSVPSIGELTTDYDFKTLLSDPIGSDFIIESAEGNKFKVHKILLSSTSEVFKAMLKENTAESQNSYMKMVDVSTEDLQCILEFIYTGAIEDLEDANFYNLLTLSDRYNLIGLRELSEYVLATQLTVDNCIVILALADLHNCDSLKIAAIKFIKCNEVVVHSELFEEFNNAELIRELCQFLVTCS